MSLFTPHRTLQTYCHYMRFIKWIKPPGRHAVISCNLEGVLRNSRPYCQNTEKLALSYEEKKCLDTLTKAFRNNDPEDNDKREILKTAKSKNLMAERIKILDYIKKLADVGTDKRMWDLIREEKAMCNDQLIIINHALFNQILEEVDESHNTKVFLEITAGVGGTEAMYFTKELCEMYIAYMKYLRFDYTVIESHTIPLGLRKACVYINDPQAFKKFKYEGGVHRVQRSPVTDKSGRMHTSTTTVAVLPELPELEDAVNEKDLRIETMRASGAGGQHVNTTESAVRLTHVPTRTTVHCQAFKSQKHNKALALIRLRNILNRKESLKQTTSQHKLRKEQIGQADRHQKIRTYNYIQDRITDHRLPMTVHDLNGFMSGGSSFDQFVEKLQHSMKKKLLSILLEKR